MTLSQVEKLRKYVESESTERCVVDSFESDSYAGGWCIRVFDKVVGSIVEVGNLSRASVRCLVAFAKAGDF